MNNSPAFKELTNTYDIEDMQEIVNHGCASGVCNQHIYYADTISFFNKYEDEILDELECCYGIDTLVDLFKEANASLDQYKNNAVWLYIEHVSSIVVTTMEEEESAQDELIASYMQPVC